MLRRDSSRLWTQFRRLLLGTTVEVLRDIGLHVDTGGLEMGFDDESVFRYPALHSEMRFAGRVRATLLEPTDIATLETLEVEVMKIWPEIVQLVRLPMVGAMDVTSNAVWITVEGSQLEIRFDLAAG